MMNIALLCALVAVVTAKSLTPHPAQKALLVKPAIDSSDPLSVLESRLPILRTDWAKMAAGHYYVHNNVWNKAGVSRYHQAVGIVQSGEGSASGGWAWRWPETNRAMAFPELVVGKSPWAPNSSHPGMPVQCRDLERLQVELELEHEGWGARGTALQIWLTDDSLAQSNQIRHELLIWLRNEGIPVKGWMADLEIGGAKYTLADDPDRGVAPQWKVFSFFRAESFAKGSMDLLPFFDYLVGKGLMDKKEWVSSIHLGTEIRGGSGLTRVKRFKLDLASRPYGGH